MIRQRYPWAGGRSSAFCALLVVTFFIVFAALAAIPARAQHGDAGTKAALAGLEIAEGLKVDLFAAEPLLFNPVAFTIDEAGRFFIAESHRWKDSIFDLWTKDDRWKLADFSFTRVEQREAFLRQEFATNLTLLTKDSEIIRLVEDKDGNGVADSSAVFAEGFNQVTSGTAAGILASDGELWFTCIPDLWKFKYDSLGASSAREVLHTGYGVRTSVSGHDLHGLVRGFDGRIYFSVGDRGAHVRTHEGTDLESVNAGAVFRCEPDGTNLELFATGLRNPQDLAFDYYGNLWTHDNDTSGEDPPRVLQVVEGGEYGWRQAYQFMPEFGPWVREKLWLGECDDILPSAGAGAQGPSGLAVYPGTGLPKKFDGALLACDFPLGVWAYFFSPKGASYELRKEKFIWALGPTDLDFGPDGSMYISDWGRSYAMPNAGKILRVTAPGVPEAKELKSLLNGGIKSKGTESLAEYLRHSDLRVRLAAQFELERREETALLSGVARASTNQFARIHALWGLGNLARRGGATPGSVLIEAARDPDPEIRAQAAQQLGAMAGQPEAVECLLRLIQDRSPRVQMHAALSLSRAGTNTAVSEGLLKLAGHKEDRDPFLRHAVVYALTTRQDINAITAASRSDDPALRRIAVLALRRLKSPDLGRFLTDSDPKVRRDAARAINDVPVPEAFASLAARLDGSETDPQILLRAINGNFRLGDQRSADRVLRFAANTSADETLRVDALQALANWNSPPPLDRVTGIWRPLNSPRETASGPQLEKVIGDALRLSNSQNLLLAALDCAEQLQLRGVENAIGQIFQAFEQPEDLRVRALNTLGKLNAAILKESVGLALRDKSSRVRAEAVSWLPQVVPSEAVHLAGQLLNTETDLRIQQSALAALGGIRDPVAAEILATVALPIVRARPELQLEFIEAVETHQADQLAREVLGGGSAETSAHWALRGGDAEKGKRIFHERDAVGCLRCHAIKGQGGVVGPDLAGIGGRRERPHLLQSILHPNAEITAGYESATVALNDGRNFSGTIQNETAEELSVNTPDDGIVTVKKQEIASRVRTLSPMPEGLGDLLTRRELRDLVEFLAGLK